MAQSYRVEALIRLILMDEEKPVGKTEWEVNGAGGTIKAASKAAMSNGLEQALQELDIA